MRILFLHTSGILGGAEKAFLDLCDQLPMEDLNQSMVVVPEHGDLEKNLLKSSPLQVQVLSFPGLFKKVSRKYPVLTFFSTLLSLPGLFFYYIRLSQLSRSKDVELIYSNGIKCHMISLVLQHFLKAKLIWHLQDFFPTISYVKYFLNCFAKGPDRVIANSDAVHQEFLKIIPKKWKTKIITIHNAVNTEIFTPAKTSLRNPKRLTISMVAMLTQWKGQHIFLEALSLLKSTNIDFHFQIVGDEMYVTHGEKGYKDQLLSFVRTHGLDKKVSFCGFTENVVKIYQESDIVVHASVQPEPFGKVIIEAMACECAVIATRAGGPLEIIIDHENGLLVTINDAKDMAQAIDQLIMDTALRHRLGSKARQHVLKNFSTISYGQKIKNVLNQMKSLNI